MKISVKSFKINNEHAGGTGVSVHILAEPRLAQGFQSSVGSRQLAGEPPRAWRMAAIRFSCRGCRAPKPERVMRDSAPARHLQPRYLRFAPDVLRWSAAVKISRERVAKGSVPRIVAFSAVLNVEFSKKGIMRRGVRGTRPVGTIWRLARDFRGGGSLPHSKRPLYRQKARRTEGLRDRRQGYSGRARR